MKESFSLLYYKNINLERRGQCLATLAFTLKYELQVFRRVVKKTQMQL